MTVVNLRLGGQGEDCAQVMSHQSPSVLNSSLYFLFSFLWRAKRAVSPSFFSLSSSEQSAPGRFARLLLDHLHQVGAKPKRDPSIKDLGSASHTWSIDGELHRQVAFIIRVVQWDPQRSQDVFGQLDVAP